MQIVGCDDIRMLVVINGFVILSVAKNLLKGKVA
ncbi:MAG: hypothetical protein JWQ66_873 [Mucilaginibacter sp.]|jgi:hypothetical protein|nr:hypothetical protein [Mucilaginibacter sp.]